MISVYCVSTLAYDLNVCLNCSCYDNDDDEIAYFTVR